MVLVIYIAIQIGICYEKILQINSESNAAMDRRYYGLDIIPGVDRADE